MNLCYFYFDTYFSEPVHKSEPISEFRPIQTDQLHFLDVTHKGLESGVNPNQEANELWARIEQSVQTTDNSAFHSIPDRGEL